MARGDSTVTVRIVGDTKSLTTALNTANTKISGFGKGLSGAGKLALGLGAIGGVATGFELIGDALAKADQHGDALQQLSRTLTPELATNVDKIGAGMSTIGLSQTAFDTLAADFAAFGLAAGISATNTADLAPNVVAAAQAFSLADSKGRPANEVLELMEKAAGGSAKAAAELGVTVDPTASKLDNMRSIVAQLNPLVVDATTGHKDLEGAQSELSAKMDNLITKLGEGLAPALSDVVGFINDEIDAIPGAIEGWQLLGKAIEDFGRKVLGPLGNVKDLLDQITPNVQGLLNPTSIFGGGGGAQTPSESAIIAAQRNHNARNGLGAP